MRHTGKKKVFLTGATGNWGRYILREFAERCERFDIVALVLPNKKDLALIREFAQMSNLTVVPGDLTDYNTVEGCVRGADFILHVGAVVSPFADDHPELVYPVNVGGVQNIIRAVKAQPHPDAIGVVMVGSVAETGDRNPPHHWGRVGDPLRAAQYDEYGQSKISAERELVESGLARWAWLRQTGIFYPAMLQIRDPIIMHSPFAGVAEWVSAEDSARLVVNICEDGVAAEFWGGIYNIGGGAGWRLTNWQLQVELGRALGVVDVRKWYERNWFATRNFHGHWFTDSDRLEELVPFRQDSFDQAIQRAVRNSPPSVRLAGIVPAWVIKNLVMKPQALQPRGTMRWMRDNDEAHIRAFFGSRQDWEAIGDWSSFTEPDPDRTPRYLDHGFDEAKSPSNWTRDDMISVASFRGGKLLSGAMTRGDIKTPLSWSCGMGHQFSGSPRLILTGGHWCPACVRDSAGYTQQAETNKFLAQVEQTATL